MFRRLKQRRPGTSLQAQLFYEFIRVVSVCLFRGLYGARTFYVERVPEQGPLLLVANHQSYLDPPVIGTWPRRHFDFVARMGLFDSPGFARVIRSLNAIPIKEEGGDAAAIKEILRRLKAGRAVIIFPEGARTHDGQMQEFKRGVAVLVKRSKCPVQPVAIAGCFDVWPRARKWPRILGMRIGVMYGEPIGHDALMVDGADAALKRLHDEVELMRVELRDEIGLER